MRKTLTILALLAPLSAAHAQSQDQIAAQIAASLPDNGRGAITASGLRGVLNSLNGAVGNVTATIGVPNGIASLDSSGRIPASQLTSPLTLTNAALTTPAISGGTLNAPLTLGTASFGSLPGGAIAFGGLTPQIYAQRAAIGAVSAPVDLNSLRVDQDQAVINSADFVTYLNVIGTMTTPNADGSPGTKGGRVAINGQVNQNVPTIGGNHNYVGVVGAAKTVLGDGGTSSSPQGAYFGINPIVILDPGAQNVLNASGGEVNWRMAAGSTVAYKSGLQLAALNGDAVQGSAYDAAISISNQAGALAPWKDGILFSVANGTYPLNPDTSYLIRSDAPLLEHFAITARGNIEASAYGGNGFAPLFATSAGNFVRLPNSVPASSGAACTIGQTAWDPNYEYRCIATNTWKRIALTAW
jgi:hypothetical protein